MRLSVFLKTFLVANFVLLAAVASVGWATHRLAINALRDEIVTAGQRTVRSFADLNRLEFLDTDRGTLNLKLRLTALVKRKDNGIARAYVLGPTGAHLTHVAEKRLPPLDLEEITEVRVLSDRDVLRIGGPVTYEKTTLGYVIMEFDGTAIEKASRHILERSGVILLISFLGNLLLFALLLRRLLRPISALGTAARSFSGGNYDHRIPEPLPKDEIGDAARGFNSMCDELQTHLQFSNAALVHRIREGKNTAEGREHHLTVVFGDAVGYTRWSQQQTPIQIFQTLRRYYTCMGELIVRRFDGIIDKFIGDGIMAHFGLLRGEGELHVEDVRHAVRSTIYSQVVLRILSRALACQGQVPLNYRFGIATGRCLVGAIGASGIMLDFSLIGGVVNLASRLEGKAVGGGIMSDRFTNLDVGDGFLRAQSFGQHQIKGFDVPIDIFGIVGFDSIEEDTLMRRFIAEEFFSSDNVERLLLLDGAGEMTRAKVQDIIESTLAETPTQLPLPPA